MPKAHDERSAASLAPFSHDESHGRATLGQAGLFERHELERPRGGKQGRALCSPGHRQQAAGDLVEEQHGQ